MNMQLLCDILSGYGPSGREGSVRAMIERALCGHVDSLETDVMGNLIAVKKGDGTGRRIMLSSHMDHIGLAVIDADENGFLRVAAVGGVNAAGMCGVHVVFENGVQGVVGKDGSAKESVTVENLFVDIGAKDREEALSMVEQGDMCVMKPGMTRLGEHRIASPAMDDRIACFVQLEAMLALPEGIRNDVVAVFSVQEEVGLRGAKTAAYQVKPDLGIGLDVTPAGDVPEAASRLPVRLGGGAAVKIMDRSLICTPDVVHRMLETARENGIAVQREVLPYGGTDGGAIQHSRCGVPTGVISIPCRYVHSTAETVDTRDVQAALDLLLAVVQK